VTLVIAHRGASAAYRENTVDAFRAARRLGADMVELDVRRTADGVLVVHHDARFPDGPAIVTTAMADRPPWVPTFDEALDACEGMGVNIEVKNLPSDPDYDEGLGVATAVAELVTARRLQERVVVSSFNMADIDRVASLDPAIPTGWLVFGPIAATTVEQCVEHGHGVLHPHWASVSADLVVAAHAARLRVNTWTVDDPDEMRRLVDLGVDGIMSNVPDVLRAVVDEAR
jgi:glycerophosphoryl diester phosphodiesterase